MPIVGDAKKVLNSMRDTYSKEKAERVFYATANKQGRKPENWKKEAAFLGLGVGKVAAAILGGQTPRHGKLSVKELIKGIKEEGEHTPNLEARKEISIDHLAKNPKYYTESEKLEKKAMAGGRLPNTSMSVSNTASSTPNVSRMPAPGGVGIQKNQGPGDLAVDPQHRSKTIIPAGGGQVSGAQGSTPGIGSGGVAQAQPMTSTASGQPGSPPTQSTGASYGMGPNLPKTAVELRRLGAYAIRYLGGI
jgi:hypothetical protein